MVTAKWRLVDPVAEIRAPEATIAPGIASLEQKTIGFIDNGWWSLGIALDEFYKLLTQEHHVARVLWRSKPDASRGAGPEVMEELASQADAAIVGLGN